MVFLISRVYFCVALRSSQLVSSFVDEGELSVKRNIPGCKKKKEVWNFEMRGKRTLTSVLNYITGCTSLLLCCVAIELVRIFVCE